MKNKILRIFLLIILLALPGSFYLFLQFFGENNYRIPVLYKDGVKNHFEDCHWETKQHVIPDFKLMDYKGNMITKTLFRGHIIIVDFSLMTSPSKYSRLASGIREIQAEFGDKPVKVLSIATDTLLAQNDSVIHLDEWTHAFGERESVYALARCGFVLPLDPKRLHIDMYKFILVDTQERIRGYYDATDTKEIERLLIEIKILLDEYASNS